MRLVIPSLFGQTIADRTTDRIDSHRSSLAIHSPFLAVYSDPTIPAEQVLLPARRERIFVREPGEKALFPPPSASALSNRSHFIRIRSFSLIIKPGVYCDYFEICRSLVLSKTDTGVIMRWDNEGDYIHVIQLMETRRLVTTLPGYRYTVLYKKATDRCSLDILTVGILGQQFHLLSAIFSGEALRT